MSIRHIGIETAKDISNHFGTFEKLWSYLLEEVAKEVEREIDKGKIEKVVESKLEAENEDEESHVDGVLSGHQNYFISIFSKHFFVLISFCEQLIVK